MSEYITIYATFGSLTQAQKIAQELVEQNVVACVNIFGNVKSVYKWNGKTETSDEVAIFAKTRSHLFDKAKNLILELHDYEIPCIVKLDISGGDEKFLSWINKETINA